MTTGEEPRVAFRAELEALGLTAPSLRAVLETPRHGGGAAAARQGAAAAVLCACQKGIREPVSPPPSDEDQLKTLRFLLRSHLSVTEIDALQATVREGRLNAGTLIREASVVRAALGMQPFIVDLRSQLA